VTDYRRATGGCLHPGTRPGRPAWGNNEVPAQWHNNKLTTPGTGRQVRGRPADPNHMTSPLTAAQDYPPRGYAWTVVAILVATAILSYTDRQVLSLLVAPSGPILPSATPRSACCSAPRSLLCTVLPAYRWVPGGPHVPPQSDFLRRAGVDNRHTRLWIFTELWSAVCGTARRWVGEAVLSPAAISLISDYFPPSRRGTAVACFLSGIAMGIGAAILIGGACCISYSWAR